MAGIATRPYNYGIAVIGESVPETHSRMAVDALGAGNRMGTGWSVGRRRCLPDGRVAVMAGGTSSGNARMIETAIRGQGKKTGGIVAVVALGSRRGMKL